MGVTLKTSGGGTARMKAGLRALSLADVLVGIPEGDNRAGDMLDRAANMPLTKSGKTSKAAMTLAKAAAQQNVSNAELLFIHTNGSPLRNIPARPVIEPAIQEKTTARLIAKQIAAAAVCAMDGDQKGMEAALERAGTIAENAAKRWFTDSRNGWAPNSALTILRKGSARPLIDTGALRRAITHVVDLGNGLSAADGNAANLSPEFTTYDIDGRAYKATAQWDSESRQWSGVTVEEAEMDAVSLL